MKKFTLVLFGCFFIFALQLRAQFTYTINTSATSLATMLLDTLGGGNVIITNAGLTCDSSASANFTSSSNLVLGDGIVLGNGSISALIGLPSIWSTTVLNQAGDTDLSSIVGTATYDACILEFDLQTSADTIEFEYVFGSDEYPTFNCSTFNDLFAFLISGPGFTNPTNIALVPNTTTAVAINSINDGTTSTSSTCGDTAYYVNNNDTLLTINGFTKPLLAKAAVTPNQVYHLKLAIADASDAILNSYVMLKSRSLHGKYTATATKEIQYLDGLTIYPTLLNDQMSITNNTNEEWSIDLYNTYGQLVIHYNLEAHERQTSISVSYLPFGSYFVQAQSKKSNRIGHFRFFKQ